MWCEDIGVLRVLGSGENGKSLSGQLVFTNPPPSAGAGTESSEFAIGSIPCLCMNLPSASTGSYL